MSPYLAEFLGTAILVVFGNGVVANVILPQNKGFGGGWISIATGWGLAVFVAAFCTAAYSGAHLNPAITIALWAAGKFAGSMVIGYIIAQMLGAILGGMLVYMFYRKHFAASDDANVKMACFCTSPAIPGKAQAIFCEAFATFLLVFAIFLITSPTINWETKDANVVSELIQPPTGLIGMGSLGLIPVALLVFALGLSLGGPTGYAINPARDLGPRIAHFLLPIPGKRDSDWGYAMVPVIGPILGGLFATMLYRVLEL